MQNKRKNTVLIISSHYPPNFGGVESHLQGLVAALKKNKWQIIISTYQPLASKVQAPFFEKAKGILVYRLPWLGFNIVHKLTHYPALELLYLFPGLFLLSLFILIRDAEKINVIHSQGLVPTAVGGILALFYRKRLVSSIHNMYFFPKVGLYKIAASFVFNMADRVLAPTQIAAAELISIGVKQEKVRLFKYWLDLDRFKPFKKALVRKQHGFNRFTVFFVGRLIETKGVKIITSMLNQLDQNIDVVIAGDGPLRTYVENFSKRQKNLIYLGRIENSKLPGFYSSSDLLIVPSTVDEGWGFVAMEAISCGTPVVASLKGGLSDVVTPSVGRLVDVNPKKFSVVINELYKNPTALERFRSHCRRYALGNFGEGNIKYITKHYLDE